MSQPAPTVRPRSIVYVDGFNLYYRALKPLSQQWLDLQAYFVRLRKDDEVRRIYYFTAELTGAKRAGHLAYLEALTTCPLVTIIAGKYQTQYLDCEVTACTYSGERRFFQFKEKRTDVNIAVQMLGDAYEDECDLHVLISGDTDLVPAVEKVRDRGKRVIVYVPNRDEDSYDAASELRHAANMARNLPLKTLDRAQFPDQIPDGKGGFIQKSAAW
jgi:uncharacterized LabA/DUF88 family protein